MFLSDALLPERRMHVTGKSSSLWRAVPEGSGGRCRVFFKRRIVLGPDLMLTLFSYVTLIGYCMYLATLVIPWWLSTVLTVLAVLILVLMVITGSMNPGIIARADALSSESLGVHFPDRVNEAGIPYPRYLTINGVSVKQKWCKTCNLYRPPRSNHCKVCDNCVLRFDHHCAFLGCCIGINNYRYFIILITCITCFSSLSMGLLFTRLLTDWSVVEDWSALLIAVGVSVAFIVLCVYHCYITSKNLTTNEHVKRYYKTNPFDYGCINNFRHVFIKPQSLLPIEDAPRITSSYSKPPAYNSDCLSDMYDG